jgi:hypothetical protein
MKLRRWPNGLLCPSLSHPRQPDHPSPRLRWPRQRPRRRQPSLVLPVLPPRARPRLPRQPLTAPLGKDRPARICRVRPGRTHVFPYSVSRPLHRPRRAGLYPSHARNPASWYQRPQLQPSRPLDPWSLGLLRRVSKCVRRPPRRVWRSLRYRALRYVPRRPQSLPHPRNLSPRRLRRLRAPQRLSLLPAFLPVRKPLWKRLQYPRRTWRRRLLLRNRQHAASLCPKPARAPFTRLRHRHQ